MDAEGYSLPQLVTDLRALCARCDDEHAILGAVRPLARRAALARASWLEDRMYHADADQGFGVYLLHEEPDHTLAVLAVSWLPRRGVPPHDHGTWAVIAGVDGPEKNEFYARVDDGKRPGYAKLRKVGEKVCGSGDVVAIPRGMIHGVQNDTDAVTVSLHIYGKHINYTNRSQFDLEAHTETPLILKVES